MCMKKHVNFIPPSPLDKHIPKADLLLNRKVGLWIPRAELAGQSLQKLVSTNATLLPYARCLKFDLAKAGEPLCCTFDIQELFGKSAEMITCLEVHAPLDDEPTSRTELLRRSWYYNKIIKTMGILEHLQRLVFVAVRIPKEVTDILASFAHLKHLSLHCATIINFDSAPLPVPYLETLDLRESFWPSGSLDLSLATILRRAVIRTPRSVILAPKNSQLDFLALEGAASLTGDLSSLRILKLRNCKNVEQMMSSCSAALSELSVQQQPNTVIISPAHLKVLMLADLHRCEISASASESLEVLFLRNVRLTRSSEAIRARRIYLYTRVSSDVENLLPRLSLKIITHLAVFGPFSMTTQPLMWTILERVAKDISFFATTCCVPDEFPSLSNLRALGLPLNQELTRGSRMIQSAFKEAASLNRFPTANNYFEARVQYRALIKRGSTNELELMKFWMDHLEYRSDLVRSFRI